MVILYILYKHALCNLHFNKGNLSCIVMHFLEYSDSLADSSNANSKSSATNRQKTTNKCTLVGMFKILFFSIF